MTTFTSPEESLAYIRAHDKRVVRLDRMPLADLRTAYRGALAKAGQTPVRGGPESADELVSAIIEIEFPDANASREAYVQSVVAG